MKLYMHPASITSRIVRLYAADKGIAIDEEVVDLFTGAHHQEPFVSVNPNRLVPVLEDGDFRLTESAAILIYLAEKLDLPEYPTDLRGRAGSTRRSPGPASTSTATGATTSATRSSSRTTSARPTRATASRSNGAATRAPSG